MNTEQLALLQDIIQLATFMEHDATAIKAQRILQIEREKLTNKEGEQYNLDVAGKD